MTDIRVSQNGLDKVLKAYRQKQLDEGKYGHQKKYSHQIIADNTGLQRSRVDNFFQGKYLRPENFKAICEELGLDWREIAEQPKKTPEPQQTPLPDNVEPPLLAGVRPEFQALIQEKTEGFVGREFVFTAIQEFFSSQPKGYFIIEADPGVGKSALLAEYVRRKGCIAHFNIRSQGINRADQFLEGVCSQLISRYKLSDPAELTPEAVQDGQFLSKLLNEVSATFKPGEKLVIAVDALDEVDQTDLKGGNILFLPITLPQGVYFILTKRPLTLPLDLRSPFHRFDLMQYQAESLADIKNYIHIRIQQSPKLQAWIAGQGIGVENFVTELGNKSENNFMYLRYVLADIEGGKYQNLSIDQLPQGLMAYYEDHWRRMGMVTKPLPRTKIKIVYVLAELQQPVSRQLIADFCSEDALTVQEVLDDWEQFLHSQQVDRQAYYSLYHQSFHDFLARKDIVQAAGVTLPDINTLIADSLSQGIFDDE